MQKNSLSLLLAAALALPGLALMAPIASAQDAGAPTARADRESCDHGARRGRHGPGRRHHDPERRIAHLTERLQLDQNQVTLVRQAMEQARAERQALRGQPRSEELRAQHRAIMARAHERIDAILTPAQRATFEQMRAERRERMERRMERRGERRGQRGGVDPRGI